MLNKLYKGADIQAEIETLEDNLKTKRNTVKTTEAKEQKLETDRLALEKIEQIEERKSVIEKALCWEKFLVCTSFLLISARNILYTFLEFILLWTIFWQFLSKRKCDILVIFRDKNV